MEPPWVLCGVLIVFGGISLIWNKAFHHKLNQAVRNIMLVCHCEVVFDLYLVLIVVYGHYAWASKMLWGLDCAKILM